MRCGTSGSNAAAAPATVSGEPVPQRHWDPPGRRQRRRPASQETCRRFDPASGGVPWRLSVPSEHPHSVRFSRPRVTFNDQISLSDAGPATEGPTIYVCITCRGSEDPPCDPRPGAVLAAATATAAQGTGVTVREVACLANCSRGPSAAMRSGASWTYIFGGLDADCASALVEGARLLARAADGILPWRGRPEPLKRGLIARVPPINF